MFQSRAADLNATRLGARIENMEHTEALGQSIAPRNCEKCGAALTDVDYDKSGRLVSRCPNRYKDLEAHCLPRVDIWWAVYRCGRRFEFLQFLLAAAHCHHHCLPPTKPRIPYPSHKRARHEQGRAAGEIDKAWSGVSRRLQIPPDRHQDPLVMSAVLVSHR